MFGWTVPVAVPLWALACMIVLGALAYDHFPEVRDFVENLPLVFNDLVRR